MSETQEKQYITIPVSIDRDLLWESTFGGGFEYSPWWGKLKFDSDGDWNKYTTGIFTISCEDPENEDKMITKTLTIDDLARGYGIALRENYHHCGTAWDLEDPDACVSDGILQLAFFGELIYG